MKCPRILYALFLGCPLFYFIQSCNNDDNSTANDDTKTAPVLCENGFAGIYPCNDYDLMGFVPIDVLVGANASGNDCWGWTDSSTQKEYALFCATNGVAFVDITLPNAPVLLGRLPTATISAHINDGKRNAPR